MAITSTVIGNLGAGKVTESRFWFESSTRRAEEINKDWDVPLGDYLFAWSGTTSTGGTSGSVLINGVESVTTNISNAQLGNYHILRNVTQIQARGTGSKRFTEDPYVAYVRIA